MKRLMAQEDIQIGDKVTLKNHPYDKAIYEVKQVLPNGTLFLDNGITSYVNMEKSKVKKEESN